MARTRVLMLLAAAMQLLPLAINTTTLQPFRTYLATCAPGCTTYGNCNGEKGQCDCPFGRSGPTCAQHLLPACHSSSAVDTLPHIGTFYPKNCLCYRQLHSLGCPEAVKLDLAQAWPRVAEPPIHCLFWTLLQWDFPCYVYEGGVAEQQQLSDPPRPGDPRASWWMVERMWPYQRILPRGAVAADKAALIFPPETPWTPQQQQQLASAGSAGGELQPAQAQGGRGGLQGHEQQLIKLADGSSWLPLDLCPNRCSERGWCMGAAGVEPACRCHSAWQGPACEHDISAACYRNCSGVGRCVEGWCHCPPGRWGLGCTRDKAYNSSEGWLPQPVGLRIYVYDLPTHVAHSHAVSDGPPTLDPIYWAEKAFTEALLGDWSVRTQNPWEANMFYVPAWVQWYAGSSGSPARVYAHVSRWLADHSPFWNASQGRNHFWFAGSDRGGCDVYAPGRSLNIQRPIMLTHFGQAARTQYAAGSTAADAYIEPLNAAAAAGSSASAGSALADEHQHRGQQRARRQHRLRAQQRLLAMGRAQQQRQQQQQEGGSTRPLSLAGGLLPSAQGQGQGQGQARAQALVGTLLALSAARLNASQQQQAEDKALMEEVCYRPEKDVVAPPNAHMAVTVYARMATFEYTPSPGGGGDLQVARRSDALPRTTTLFFAGTVRGAAYYSQGVRQALGALFGPGGRHDPQGPNARPDVTFLATGNGVVQAEGMRKAKYCLAVTGHGWGVRLVEALLCGCVPVIIQDYTYQPLWDVVPYEEFSVRLARRDMGRLMALLDAISPQQLEALQRGVDKWHRAFLWQVPGVEPPGVGLAYNFTVRALERRLASFNSDNYR